MPAFRPLPRVQNTATDRFARQALKLCQELERWRAEQKQLAQTSSDMFPVFERRAGIQALIFFITLMVSAKGASYVLEAHNAVATLSLIFVITISAAAAPILFVFQALGLGKIQFWRAMFSWRKKGRRNYPFTPLIDGIQHDFEQRIWLQRFSTGVLKVVLDRIGQDEAELRERLNVFIGSPTAFVLFGIAGGVFTTWESYYRSPDSIGHAVLFYGSILTLLLGAYGFRLRVALLEFSSCRGLLSLEIAQRSESHHRRANRS